jgi:integrase
MTSRISKTVTIENHGGRLRLAWHDGSPKRRTLSIGMPDSIPGRALAKKRKLEIENDLAIGKDHYDRSLLKYKSLTLGNSATEISCEVLFERFTHYRVKAKGLSPFTVKSRYKAISVMLAKYLDRPANEVDRNIAEKFADNLVGRMAADTAKQRIWLLKSCWDWAKDRYQVAEVNPWLGISDRFQAQPKDQVEPFTKDEVFAILQGFRDSHYYVHYLDFVMFLLGTGCRPGEAVGLRWANVSKDFSTVYICRSMTDGIERPTKTKRSRSVNLSSSVAAMLHARAEVDHPKPDDRVFSTPKGLPIDMHRFRSRAWTQVLKAAGVPYRKPYATRHTAVTHALANGANYIDVAKATGHSIDVMHKSYANSINKESVFVDFAD